MFNLKRKLLSAYWYEGKCYEFKFSKFGRLLAPSSISVKPTRGASGIWSRELGWEI